MNTIGIRLKELRKAAKLTQADAARTIGITQQNWQSAETGKSNMPYEKLSKLATHFKINLSWLMTGEGTKEGASSEMINTQTGKVISVLTRKVLAQLKGKSPKKESIQDVIFLPGLKTKKECYAIEVNDRNMEPEIKEGALIILEPVIGKSEFRDNKPYVIILEGVPFLKKVSMILSGKDKGNFELSTLQDNRIQMISEKEIKEWYRVIYVLNPV